MDADSVGIPVACEARSLPFHSFATHDLIESAHVPLCAPCTRAMGLFLPRLGSRMVRLSTSALPAQGSVSCHSLLTDYQGAVSWSMDTGVVGLRSWRRVLSAQSIKGGSGEVTRHRLTDHLSFHLLHGWGKYPLIGNKILVTCSQICYHRGENRWVGWVRLTRQYPHPTPDRC